MAKVCDVCGAEEQDGPCSKCEHIKEKFNRMRDDLYDVRNQLDTIRSTVKNILDDYNQAFVSNKDGVAISRETFETLWVITDCRSVKCEQIQEYVEEKMVEEEVIKRSLDMFKSKGCLEKNIHNKVLHLGNAVRNYVICKGTGDNLDIDPALYQRNDIDPTGYCR